MTFSVIIPVYREKFEDTVCSVLKQTGQYNVEVIVSKTDEEDGLNLRHDKIKTVHSGKGRALQMNTGAKAAEGDILLFLHADTILPENAFEKMSRVLSNKTISGGAFSLKINSRHLFLKAASFLTNLRSRLNRIPYGDQALFIRKDIFNRIGGYLEIPIMEDVELMRRMRKMGFKITILSDKAVTSARRWEKDGLFRTTFRNRLFSVLYSIGVRPEILAKYRA